MSTVAFDFDGVIHAYTRGWQDGQIYDEPVEGIFDLIREVQTKHAVFIYSTRDSESIAHWLVRKDPGFRCVTERGYRSGYQTTWWWDNGVVTNAPMVRGQEIFLGTIKFWNDHENIFVTDRKLPALAYVDDRAVRFLTVYQTRNELIDRGYLEFKAAGRGVASTLENDD